MNYVNTNIDALKCFTSNWLNYTYISKYGDYLNNLSDASKETFKIQGGELSNEEIYAFESNLDKDIYLRMRAWDDIAKKTDFTYEKNRNIGFYESMACNLFIFN